MSIETCMKQAKNRQSYCCLRSAELRRNKSPEELNQKEAMKIANKEYEENK